MSGARKLLYGIAAVALVLGAAELILRGVGFRYQPVPERIWLGRYEGGIPTGEVIFDRMVPGLFTRDADLFWRPVAGKPPFNRAGLRDDRQLPERKPPGEVRILTLGDSCTFLGEPVPWPDVLERRLAEDGRRVRVLNAAVPAWTSLQGARYLEQEGLTHQPDWVTIYFGWNDHWRATVKPDADFPRGDAGVVALQRVLSRARLYQWLHRMIKGGEGSGETGQTGDRDSLEDLPEPASDLARQALQRPFRVPLDQFEENLRRMVVASREAGARPVLITAPSTLTARRVPRYLFVHGFVAMGGEPVDAIHGRYAAAVRAVARDTGALLVDAARVFAGQPEGEALMREDGIHLTAAGIRLMASLVEEAIRSASQEESSPSVSMLSGGRSGSTRPPGRRAASSSPRSAW